MTTRYKIEVLIDTVDLKYFIEAAIKFAAVNPDVPDTIRDVYISSYECKPPHPDAPKSLTIHGE